MMYIGLRRMKRRRGIEGNEKEMACSDVYIVHGVDAGGLRDRARGYEHGGRNECVDRIGADVSGPA